MKCREMGSSNNCYLPIIAKQYDIIRVEKREKGYTTKLMKQKWKKYVGCQDNKINERNRIFRGGKKGKSRERKKRKWKDRKHK